MATAKPKAAVPVEPESESSVRAKLADKALRLLRGQHPDEYEAILGELCDEAGIPLRRRLTGEAGKRARAEALAAELGLTLVPATAATPVAE